MRNILAHAPEANTAAEKDRHVRLPHVPTVVQSMVCITCARQVEDSASLRSRQLVGPKHLQSLALRARGGWTKADACSGPLLHIHWKLIC